MSGFSGLASNFIQIVFRQGLLMNMFSWLLLGHLLGDWLLQNDWMARGKKRGLFTKAGMVHFVTYTAIILLVFWLFNYGKLNPGSTLVAGIIVFVSHWLIDATDIVQGWMHFYGQSDREMVRVMVDQTLHLLALGSLTCLPLLGQ
jgi:hypothetical protein